MFDMIDQSNVSIVAQFNFSTAFTIVDHKILFRQLNYSNHIGCTPTGQMDRLEKGAEKF